MAGASLTFNDKEFKRFFNSIGSNIKDMQSAKRKYIRLISPIAFKDVIKHFEEEKGPDGKWDDWSDNYRKFLQRKGLSGNNILQNNGRLRQSTVPSFGKKAGGGEITVLVNRAKTSNNFPYAQHHDEGKSSWKGNPRSFMWLSDGAQELVAKASLFFMLREK